MKFEKHTLGSGEIVIPVPESYRDCFELIKSDRYRMSGRRESVISILLRIIKPFSSSVLFWLRLSHYDGILSLFCRYMYKRASRKSQIQIPPSTRIGYGFYIGHGICMVVNGKTIIGNNVNLSQFLNIGTNKSTPAIIGDNVYVGPHACIVEDVKIGSNVTIGAGAVVIKDIPDNATAVGVPAKVISYDSPGQYICHKYPILSIKRC